MSDPRTRLKSASARNQSLQDILSTCSSAIDIIEVEPFLGESHNTKMIVTLNRGDSYPIQEQSFKRAHLYNRLNLEKAVYGISAIPAGTTAETISFLNGLGCDFTTDDINVVNGQIVALPGSLGYYGAIAVDGAVTDICLNAPAYVDLFPFLQDKATATDSQEVAYAVYYDDVMISNGYELLTSQAGSSTLNTMLTTATDLNVIDLTNLDINENATNNQRIMLLQPGQHHLKFVPQTPCDNDTHFSSTDVNFIPSNVTRGSDGTIEICLKNTFDFSIDPIYNSVTDKSDPLNFSVVSQVAPWGVIINGVTITDNLGGTIAATLAKLGGAVTSVNPINFFNDVNGNPGLEVRANATIQFVASDQNVNQLTLDDGSLAYAYYGVPGQVYLNLAP